MKTTIGIVDDHQLFVKSLIMMLNSFKLYTVIVDAFNGKDLQEKLKGNQHLVPQILLLDVNMPVMNGVETCKWVKANYPDVKIVALSMNDNEETILSMIKAGACSYLLKDNHPDHLEKALQEISENGYYNADFLHTNLQKVVNSLSSTQIDLSGREIEFLKYCCTEYSYKEIASKMDVSLRTIDGYRESLFQKLNVHSRVGLALEGIRRKLVIV